ncbi:TatD family hydrolase [Alienimonas californiensis]|uniref:Putative deoxyribonuclease YcfH n=1 Tax=Alienimonas californiensis TaxID=2527989 RepID=A0A517P9Y2_9PLAN|nr:TatD family hydrolase [Alienimonas californiensis]QDT16174.1 putative deoxyribonuclease YcfH [Alienimonas californiensis]
MSRPNPAPVPPPLPLIDTHTHLQEDGYVGDLAETIARAADAGVGTLFVVGIDRATSEAAVSLAEQHDALFAVVGVQPNYVHQTAPDDRDRITELAAHPRVVAVGETGLDHYWDYAPHDLQEEWFRWHLGLSVAYGKPFVVHCREAEADTVRVMREFAELPGSRDEGAAGAEGLPPGVMHSFAGDAETARRCLDLGLHLSFSGMVTYKKNKALLAVAADCPADRLLVETDCPYLVPTPRRGKVKRNEPAYVAYTLSAIAEARGLPAAELAETTTANARRLFGLDDAPSR